MLCVDNPALGQVVWFYANPIRTPSGFLTPSPARLLLFQQPSQLAHRSLDSAIRLNFTMLPQAWMVACSIQAGVFLSAHKHRRYFIFQNVTPTEVKS